MTPLSARIESDRTANQLTVGDVIDNPTSPERATVTRVDLLHSGRIRIFAFLDDGTQIMHYLQPQARIVVHDHSLVP